MFDLNKELGELLGLETLADGRLTKNGDGEVCHFNPCGDWNQLMPLVIREGIDITSTEVGSFRIYDISRVFLHERKMISVKSSHEDLQVEIVRVLIETLKFKRDRES